MSISVQKTEVFTYETRHPLTEEGLRYLGANPFIVEVRADSADLFVTVDYAEDGTPMLVIGANRKA